MMISVFINGLKVAALILLCAFITRKRKWIWVFICTLPRDLRFISRLLVIFRHLHCFQWNNTSIGEVFDENVKKNADKAILYFEDEIWTNKQVQRYSNKIANYFQKQGFKKGDTVALFMNNDPKYICVGLGLSKIGVVAALTNYNLRLQSLRHCFEAVNVSAVIYSEDLSEVMEIDGLHDTRLYSICSDKESPSISSAVHLSGVLEQTPDIPPVVPNKIGFQDQLFYIYTSGTTGLPKAAIIKHSRYMMFAVGGFYLNGMSQNDIIYTALPLYHGSANMAGGGAALCCGVPLVIRKKFSASNFWKDCIRYNATVAQYVGEMCRYLLNEPQSPLDTGHKVRLMIGNGLRCEIWPGFVKRFNIPQINELYAATEGNCTMVNIDSKVGAVGFLSWHLSWVLPYQIIKVDEVTGEPIRNSKGTVIPCQPDEPGEMISRIQRNHPVRDYLGYADKNSSNGKILRNAFRKDDAWFRSGDILTRDTYGYFYFKERKGDTFRWKGENCSTAEVESVVSGICALRDVIVYGVEVPGIEGRAGMAAIADPDESLDLNQLAQQISKSLPGYARPLFVRTLKCIEKTGTFKLQKMKYQKEGFDITQIPDKVYMLQGNEYVVLTIGLYQEILCGKIRL